MASEFLICRTMAAADHSKRWHKLKGHLQSPLWNCEFIKTSLFMYATVCRCLWTMKFRIYGWNIEVTFCQFYSDVFSFIVELTWIYCIDRLATAKNEKKPMKMNRKTSTYMLRHLVNLGIKQFIQMWPNIGGGRLKNQPFMRTFRTMFAMFTQTTLKDILANSCQAIKFHRQIHNSTW